MHFTKLRSSRLYPTSSTGQIPPINLPPDNDPFASILFPSSRHRVLDGQRRLKSVQCDVDKDPISACTLCYITLMSVVALADHGLFSPVFLVDVW